MIERIHIEDETYDALEAIILRHMPEAHGCARAELHKAIRDEWLPTVVCSERVSSVVRSTSLWRSCTGRPSATTDIDLADLRVKAKAADAVAPAEWECDRERMTDAPNKHHEFFAIDGNGNRLLGTENADAEFGLIEIDDDGDGFVTAWNENSRCVIEFLVASQPRVILDLIDRIEAAEALIAKSGKGTPVYKAVEKILDEHSAWIARPNRKVAKSVALSAVIAADIESGASHLLGELHERCDQAEAENARLRAVLNGVASS